MQAAFCIQIMLVVLLDILVYLAVGAGAVWVYYHWLRKDLPGGFWGALVIAVIGAVLMNYTLSIRGWFMELINWLMVPKLGNEIRLGVNLIATCIGALLFVYILNHINHDRERR
ncbi:MAG: hypothetical protein KDK39_15415 [Leptospiraceae bacterium]|nr:hypothetical protein [Leptospiraceae bacterium]